MAKPSLQSSRQPSSQSVTFLSDGLRLSGAVHVPDDLRPGERRAAIVMMHGFGANKNGGPEWVCRQCAEWGYVALRFDFRGCGESEGPRGRIIPSEEVIDARSAVAYLAARGDVEPGAIALCGSSLGGGVAVQAAGIDTRVAAVIVENGVAAGERMMRGMHTDQSWRKFRTMLDEIARDPATASTTMIHRFDMFEMPKELQVNLRSNDSLMHFTADTALGFFAFRPEEFAAAIAPRPLLILHSARDSVTQYEEAFSLVRNAKPPVELHLLDGTDHFMFVNADPRVATTLRSWLDRYFPARRDDAVMLSASFAVLAATVLFGSALAVPYLRGGAVRAAPWPVAALHGIIGIGGLGFLVLGLRGPAPGLDQGTAMFGPIAAALLGLATLAGLCILYLHRGRKRRAATLIGVHATLAISGFVVLAAYLFA